MCIPTPLAGAVDILVVSPLNTIRTVQNGDGQLVEDEEGARCPPHLRWPHHQLHAQVNSRLVQNLLFGSTCEDSFQGQHYLCYRVYDQVGLQQFF